MRSSSSSPGNYYYRAGRCEKYDPDDAFFFLVASAAIGDMTALVYGLVGSISSNLTTSGM